jgi:hypothetical protein
MKEKSWTTHPTQSKISAEGKTGDRLRADATREEAAERVGDFSPPRN